MGQLKVRFTVEYQDEQSSFASLSDLKQHSYSDLLLRRLVDFEIHLKQAAANVWLRQKLGADNHSSVQIMLAQEDRAGFHGLHMPKA